MAGQGLGVGFASCASNACRKRAACSQRSCALLQAKANSCCAQMVWQHDRSPYPFILKLQVLEKALLTRPSESGWIPLNFQPFFQCFQLGFGLPGCCCQFFCVCQARSDCFWILLLKSKDVIRNQPFESILCAGEGPVEIWL